MTARERKAKWNGMNWVRQEKRLAIYLRDGLACVYCGLGVEQIARLTLDHVIPVEKGGTNDAENLVIACDVCNSAKGQRELGKFAPVAARFYNHDLTSTEIMVHVTKCRTRSLKGYLAQAKVAIKQRGSAARALLHMRERQT